MSVVFLPVLILFHWMLLLLIGLPMTLACLQRERRWLIAPLSPLVAMALLSCAYQYWCVWLIQPYRPLVVHGAVTVFSLISLLVALLARREKLAPVGYDIAHGLARVWPLLMIPLLGIIAFSAFFWSNGLELLSGHEDELAYIETTRHVMEHLFTRDALDFPWGRADHYLGDFTAHSLAYRPDERMGAYFLLADLSAMSGLSAELAFPVLVGSVIAIATASLGILELVIRRSRLAVLAAQAAFAAAWLLVMLHIQGSLANLVSLGVRLGGLVFIFWACAYTRKTLPLVLSGILGAGWLVLYHESIGFGLVLPLAVSLVGVLWRAVRGRPALAALFAARIAMLAVLVYALQANLFMAAVAQHRGRAAANAVFGTNENLATAIKRANDIAASRLPPVLGYSSLYDDSSVNADLTSRLQPYTLGTFLSLAVLAALGFWCRLPAGSREGWAAMPVLLAFITLSTGSQANGDSVILIRSAQMAIPYIFVGISLLTFARRGLLGVRSVDTALRMGFLGRLAAAMVWITVVGLNGFSIARTIGYMNRFSQETDPILHRYDSDAPRWVEFRELLRSNEPAPVLLSGFNDTPTPHLIADGLRSVPHVMGQTITTFWWTIDPTQSVPKTFDQFRILFRHWLTPSELVERVRDDPVSNWPETYASLIARTRQAIVPLSGGYPVEWGEWSELWGPRAWRFPNLCDVLDRIETGFVVQSKSPASGRDELGLFWLAHRTLKASPRLQHKASAIIEVAYSGPVPRIVIDGVEASGQWRNAPVSGKRVLGVNVVVGPDSLIEVLASTETRLRSIQLYQPLSAVP
jgi:hypothetical protein